jgi:hypothetical protein
MGAAAGRDPLGSLMSGRGLPDDGSHGPDTSPAPAIPALALAAAGLGLAAGSMIALQQDSEGIVSPDAFGLAQGLGSAGFLCGLLGVILGASARGEGERILALRTLAIVLGALALLIAGLGALSGAALS